jgi:dTDP-glucose pyrophosphorylase
MKPTLLVLAAGMGSRYGSLKQLDSFGPNGETIIDYSVYDAIKAGFGKIVFIVRESFKEEIKSVFTKRFGDRIKLEFVTQEIEKVPDFFSVPAERQKPWGTAHAVMMGASVIEEPFGVINADDYYGVESYKTLADFLTQDTSDDYAVISYYLRNTLSEHGTVNRGVCNDDGTGNLSTIVERLKISKVNGGGEFTNEENAKQFLSNETLVSMNMFGFKPSFFKYSAEQFADFLRARGTEDKSEFFIPLVIDNLIKSGVLNVKLLACDSEWFGVTYKEDKPNVVARINDLIERNVYPADLWA